MNEKDWREEKKFFLNDANIQRQRRVKMAAGLKPQP